MNTNMQIQGIFIPFDSDEDLAVRAILEDAGFAFDGQGIKEYILSTVEGEEETAESGNPLVSIITGYMNAHPEQVQKAVQGADRIAAAVLKKVLGTNGQKANE